VQTCAVCYASWMPSDPNVPYFACDFRCRFGSVPAPQNGVVSLPLRLRDAATPVLAVCGNDTAPRCVLDDLTPASYSVSRIVCTLPPGAGAGFEVLLRDMWTSLVAGAGPLAAVPVGYAPPEVTAVSPTTLPITGSVVSITGLHFGSAACPQTDRRSDVWLQVTQAPAESSTTTFDVLAGHWTSSALQISAPMFVPCPVTVWRDTFIECVAPPGLDSTVVLRVTAGGQVNITTGLLGYIRPFVQSVVTPERARSVGGTVLTVTGTGFPAPPWPLAVVVGGALCDILPDGRSSATSITCRTPRGGGVAPVTVHTLLQASLATDVLPLVYASPVVTRVDPEEQARPVEGGFVVSVYGDVRELTCITRHRDGCVENEKS
jgi:hypothetical protein